MNPLTHAARDVNHTYHPLSAEELAILQSCFNALKEKFVVLMREKADLLEKIQEDEMIITKLESETEAIGTNFSFRPCNYSSLPPLPVLSSSHSLQVILHGPSSRRRISIFSS